MVKISDFQLAGLGNESNIPAMLELEMVLPALYHLVYAPENCPGLQETSGFVRRYTECFPGLTGHLVHSCLQFTALL